MFSTTKLSSNASQFYLEGGVYFVSNEQGDGEAHKTWKIKKYKEVDDTSRNVTKSNFDNAFPQAGESLDGLTSSYNSS